MNNVKKKSSKAKTILEKVEVSADKKVFLRSFKNQEQKPTDTNLDDAQEQQQQ
jgi:hypothetical protein